MTRHRTLMGATMITLALATPVFAQTATTTTPAPADATTTAGVPAATAPAPMDCDAQFKAMDTDANGYLSETEAAQVYASGRIADLKVDEKGYDHDAFVKICTDNAYARKAPEAGAPFEGANSFTEAQAQDRALAWGVAGVSALTKDDKGVWRGTGTVDGAAVSVAIDYKGNVVTTAN